MKKNVLVFGLIAGLIVSVWMVFGISLCYKSGSFVASMVIGYSSMLLAFSLIFVAIKNYRDKYNNGIITFGKALQIGLLIALIASTMYVLVWLFYYYTFAPDFVDKYAAHMIDLDHKNGANATKVAKTAADIAWMRDIYKSNFMIILYTYFEILPVGLLVAFIAAAILKRKTPKGNVAVAV